MKMCRVGYTKVERDFGRSKGTRFNLGLIPAMFLTTLTVISSTLLLVPATNAEPSSITASVNVASACSLTASNDSPHLASIPPGTYQTDIGSTTLRVFCNDDGGFSLYAIGYTDSQYGKNTLTALIGGELIPTEDIVSGTATSGNTSNWAMKLDTDLSTTYPVTIEGGFDSYSTVPSTYTKVASRTAGTDTGSSATGAELTTTYAAFITSNQSAGTYNGKVKYTMVHPIDADTPPLPQSTAAGKICYYANSNSAEGTMGCQEVGDSDTSAKLFASNFSRTGYGFAGWSDKFDYATNSDAHFYGPNEDISFAAGQYTGNNPGLSLYAVWVKSKGNFQDANETASVCNNLTRASVSGTRTLSSISALTDTRDNQTYAIAKLADGNCWMIENLRLADTHQEGVNTVPTTLTTLNTNNPLNDGDPTNPTVTLKHNYSDTETYNTLSATSNSSTSWCKTNSAACDNQSRIRTDNTANRPTYTTGQTMPDFDGLYSYGNYYNWYSATAGRGTYGFSTNNNGTVGDLCPTNWRLPKGGNKTRIESNDDNDFWNLVVDVINGGAKPANYTSSTAPYYTGAEEAGPVDALIRTWPNNFVHSGSVNGASLDSRGSSGYYWSSTANSTRHAYYLNFYSTYVYPGTNYYEKYYGRTIRCMIPSGS